MDWCIMDYDKANHPPVVSLDHPSELVVSEDEHVVLSTTSSGDPDGDELRYLWMHYREPGSYSERLTIDDAGSSKAGFTAPAVSQPETLHIILTVTDKGTPSLSRYARIIVSVLPANN